jgi:NAD(P)-dependent dehydrogenase (short-subunit alcohol dehydrogenase family)
MNTNIIRKLAGIVALLSGGSLGIGAVIAKRLRPNGGNVASVFVTNGGYNGVQQVVRLSTCFRHRRRRSNCEERLSKDGENH